MIVIHLEVVEIWLAKHLLYIYVAGKQPFLNMKISNNKFARDEIYSWLKYCDEDKIDIPTEEIWS